MPAAGLVVVEVGAEAARHALPAPRLDPVDGEVVDGEVEVLHLRGAEQRAGVEVVVLGEAVGEGVADHEDHAAAVAEHAAQREADEHDEHREVEEQVAGLAQVAALGADGVRRGAGLVLDGAQPVAALAQGLAGAVQHDVGVLVGASTTRGRAGGSGCGARAAAGRAARAGRPACGAGCSRPARPSAAGRPRRTTASCRRGTARACRRSASASGGRPSSAWRRGSRCAPAG